MKLIFSSNNKHKIREIQQLLGNTYQIVSLESIGCFEEMPETQDTIEGNASQKSFYVFNKYGVNCFSDDTGLEVEALNNQPGVYSARYAGNQKNNADNIQKVLNEMKGLTNRNARFKTIISLVIDGVEKQFEGIVDGVILSSLKGDKGFGYDSIFQPNEYSLSFAEMDIEEKNKISHRGIAVNKLVEYLRSIDQKI